MLTLQIILNASLILFTLLLCVAVVYLIFILKDIQKTIKNLSAVANTVIAPIGVLAGFIEGVTNGIKSIRNLKNSFSKEKEDVQ